MLIFNKSHETMNYDLNIKLKIQFLFMELIQLVITVCQLVDCLELKKDEEYENVRHIFHNYKNRNTQKK